MSHLTKLSVLAALIASVATAEPHGTWKLNPQKSHFDPGPPLYKSLTLKFDPADQGMYRVTVTGENSDGSPISTSYLLRDDGKDYPVKNAPFNTIAVTELDANTSLIVTKLNGNVFGKSRAVVKGNTMTETTDGTDPKGKAFHSVTVYEKQ